MGAQCSGITSSVGLIRLAGSRLDGPCVMQRLSSIISGAEPTRLGGRKCVGPRTSLGHRGTALRNISRCAEADSSMEAVTAVATEAIMAEDVADGTDVRQITVSTPE